MAFAGASTRTLIAAATEISDDDLPITDTTIVGTEAYNRTALDFQVWLNDWRETACAVVTRRDHLIRLGLARARRKGGKDDDEVELELEVAEVVE